MPMKEVEVEETVSGRASVRGYRRNWAANQWMDPAVKARLIEKVYAVVPKEAHQTIILGATSMSWVEAWAIDPSVSFRMKASYLAGVLRDCADCGRKVEVQAHVLGSDDDRWCGLCRARREAQRKEDPLHGHPALAMFKRPFQVPVASLRPSEVEARAAEVRTQKLLMDPSLAEALKALGKERDGELDAHLAAREKPAQPVTPIKVRPSTSPPRRFPEVEERMAVMDRKLISFGHAEDARSVGLGCLVGPKISDRAAFFAAPELLTAIDGWVASGRALKLPEYLKRCRLLERRAWWQR